ncbi:hypothetical protein ABH944_007792 [Caballeronia udeis]|uniref:Pathogenesis-related transcriptional factor and ERF protein n=1 Tax=Caballeronia udeis TaxID=1232866 RepID=A0ABW8MUS2_9BURK
MKVISLTRGKVAIVDDEDYEALSAFKWYAMRDRRKHVEDVWYAARGVWNRQAKRMRHIQMQRDLMNPQPGFIVAFRNHDGLDCRRENLVITTKSRSNAQRRLKQRDLPKGVRFIKGWFEARILSSNTSVGFFNTPEEAAVAYQAASVEHGFDRLELEDVKQAYPMLRASQ